MPRPWKNTDKIYGRIFIMFHWTVFSLLFLQAVVFYGFTSYKAGIIIYYLLGFILLLTTVLHTFWWFYDRRVLRFETTPLGLARFSRALSLFQHVMVIAVPLSACYWVAASFGAINIFGLLSLPPITPVNPDFGRAMKGLYILSFWSFFALFVLQAVVTVCHHILLKDKTLQRMGLASENRFFKLKKKKTASPSPKVVIFPKKYKK